MKNLVFLALLIGMPVFADDIGLCQYAAYKIVNDGDYDLYHKISDQCPGWFTADNLERYDLATKLVNQSPMVGGYPHADISLDFKSQAVVLGGGR